MSKTINGFINQKCSIQRKAQTPYGGETIILYENLPCRFLDYGGAEYNSTIKGEIKIGKAQAWLNHPLPNIKVGDYFVIKEFGETYSYTIKWIERRRDIDGNFDHTKLVLV